ncbi:MAG TPA: Gfo/Idh/MocA family oxidoreductase [Polyangiales bacterium]|jgi:predicted dehydrogenase|nr:Gfo/Idh/MocA family oxidoreductase [Polyangiales bacterium]
MIRVAIVGAGRWGPNLVRNFHNGKTSVVSWVADLDEKRLQAIEGRYTDLSLTTDLNVAIRDPEVDAVVIATPASTHYELTKAVLDAKKHVLVEKPIATNSRHAHELTERAAHAKRVLMVGHVFVYNSAVTRIKRILDDGELGRTYYIAMVRTNLGPIRMDVNAAWDLATHDISIANYWLGGMPLTASAVGGTWINSGLEDAVFATLRYPSNVLVNLHASWLSPRKCRDVTVIADRKMLSFDDLNLAEPLRIYDKQVTDERMRPNIMDTASYRASVREGDIVIPRVSVAEPLKAECDHFIECIRDNKPPSTGGLEGGNVVRVLEAMERSVQNGGCEVNVE